MLWTKPHITTIQFWWQETGKITGNVAILNSNTKATQTFQRFWPMLQWPINLWCYGRLLWRLSSKGMDDIYAFLISANPPLESSTSLGEIVSTKPPIQPSTGGSLSGSKLSCVSSTSAASSSSVAAASAAPNTTASHPQRGMGVTYEGLAANPAYMSPSMFLPHAFLHHHPYEFYDRYFRNGLQPPQPPPPPPPLLLPPAPAAAGMMPNIRCYPPPWPQAWMYSEKPEAGRDTCKVSIEVSER